MDAALVLGGAGSTLSPGYWWGGSTSAGGWVGAGVRVPGRGPLGGSVGRVELANAGSLLMPRVSTAVFAVGEAVPRVVRSADAEQAACVINSEVITSIREVNTSKHPCRRLQANRLLFLIKYIDGSINSTYAWRRL